MKSAAAVRFLVPTPPDYAAQGINSRQTNRWSAVASMAASIDSSAVYRIVVVVLRRRTFCYMRSCAASGISAPMCP